MSDQQLDTGTGTATGTGAASTGTQGGAQTGTQAAAAAATGTQATEGAQTGGTQQTQQAATILGENGATGEQQTQTAPATWPTDWRDRLATEVKPGDKKFRDRLERFASPVEVTRSWMSLEQKLSEGAAKPSGPPKDATAEQLATWRKDNGVPEKPENYSLELPGGIKFDEDDKPLLDKFLASAHAKGFNQQQVTDGLMQFHDLKQTQDAQLSEFDNTQKTKSEDTLRAAFGGDYHRNVAIANNYVATMPEDLVKDFMTGRLGNGVRIGADPRMIQWLVQQGLEYPSLAPVGGEGQGGKSIEGRLAEIRQIARDTPDKYDADKALQKEQQDLIERQSRQRSRAA